MFGPAPSSPEWHQGLDAFRVTTITHCPLNATWRVGCCPAAALARFVTVEESSRIGAGGPCRRRSVDPRYLVDSWTLPGCVFSVFLSILRLVYRKCNGSEVGFMHS